MTFEQNQQKLTDEVNSLNNHAGTITLLDQDDIPVHDGTTVHDVLEERANKRRKERDRAEYNSSLANGLLQA